MQVYKKILFLGSFSGLLLIAGCMEPGQPFGVAPKSDPGVVNRFQNANPDGPSAVESAIELSKKYAALSEEMGKLQLEKENLTSENSRLTQSVTALETELTQAKKELKEANDLLIEMRIELNNWKTDVLGFRDEMRKADKTQLETLVKILKVLGGEVKTDTPSEPPSQEDQTTAPNEKAGGSNDKP